MNLTSKETLKSCIDRVQEIIDNMMDRGEFYDQDGRPYADSASLEAVRAELSALVECPLPQGRVLVTVSGGVADYISDGSVAVEVFDLDNYDDDPKGTGLPSPAFRFLAEQHPVISSHLNNEAA